MKKSMLYEGAGAPGRSPICAQIATVFEVEPNFEHSSHEVRWEPGKNFWVEWMPSALQPTSAIAATASHWRSAVLLFRPRGRCLGNGDWERDVRIAEEGSRTQKKFEEVPRASTCLAS
jgi:hypothetical protein